MPLVCLRKTQQRRKMAEKAQKELSTSRAGLTGLIIFIGYVIILALAAVSEVFDLGWFDHPVFK